MSKKKAVLVILSLLLSLILLNTTYTAINGFDVDAYIAKNAVADFYITDFSVQNYGFGNINISGISENCLSEISNLPGLETEANVYAKEIFQPLPDNMIKHLEEVNTDNSSAAVQHLLSEKNTSTLVYGVDDFLNDKITLTAGEWNAKQWAMGNYAIVDDFFYQGNMDDGQSPFYQIGDSVTLAGVNGTDHTYTVMGIGDLNYNLDTHYTSDFGLSIIVPEVSYRTLYGDTQPLCTVFNVDETNTPNAENWIDEYCRNTETNLTYISHKVYEQEFKKDKITYSIVDGILAIILALIGLLNFVNAVATSIITRQKELAMLGAIGMSRKQTKHIFYIPCNQTLHGIFVPQIFNIRHCHLHSFP